MLAERLDAPVCVGYQHNDAFPGSHPLFAGPLGYNGSKAGMELISKADVVLALGTRLNPFSTLPGYGIDYWPKDAKIIQVDADHKMLGLVKKISVGICGDAGAAARALTARLADRTLACDATRDARGADSVLVRQIADVLGCGFPFHRGTGGKNDFLQLAALEARFELVEAQLLRADTVQRRQMPQQHEITPAKISSLFQHLDVHRCLHNAQRRGIACLVGAQRAALAFTQGATVAAASHFLHGSRQHLRQLPSALPVALQQVIGHTLGGFVSHPGQAAQRVHQLPYQRRHRAAKKVT